MSTSASLPGPAKKINSWVRPGVCDVRASAFRPVSALIRLDLPTLERPAKAISWPRIGGSAGSEPAAAVNCHSPANSLRPDSTSSAVNSNADAGAPFMTLGRSRRRAAYAGVTFFFEEVLDEVFYLFPGGHQIIENLDLG